MDAPPRWDVSDLFPGIGSREYAAAREALTASLTRLAALYDEHDVRGRPGAVVDETTIAAFEAVVAATNTTADELQAVGAYAASFVATDSRDDLAQRESAGIAVELAGLNRLRTRFDAWVASMGADALVAASPVAADHAYPLFQAEQRASRQMSEVEEHLAADLGLTGGTAWARLYGTVTSQLTAEIDGPDGPQTLPMSRVRGLANSPDADLRRRAYVAELAAWEAASVPIIAALNAIKGEATTLNRRRGWVDDLEPALVANSIDRATLDALHAAVGAHLPTFRRYLRTKARLLGRPEGQGLPWFDLFAPVGDDSLWSWPDATATVEAAFDTYGPQLGSLVRRAVAERWIDAEPRDGKRDGASCMRLTGDRSLVLVNFDGAFRGVQTLAHELGHAYHNVTLADRTPMQRALPMSLAETASIFCETITIEAGLATAEGGARLALLDSDLQQSCQVVVDIHSRFLFERDFCTMRASRTVSATEACELMLAAQDASYGDGLDADLRHPYMWAAKLHYYKAAFYNWPYTFGLLFGLGLYARFTEDPDRFRSGYDDLLSSVGMASAPDLAARFDIDLRDEAFWASSLQVIARRIDEFEALAVQTAATPA